MNIDDGVVVDSHIYWADRRGQVTAARGLDLSAPALESLSVAALHGIEDEWRSALRMLPAGCRAQFRYSQFTEFQQQLLAYYDATRERAECGSFTERQRDEIYGRYAGADADGRLRGNCCRLYLIAPLPGGMPRRSKRGRKSSSQQFDALCGEITRMMQRLGGNATQLSGEDLFKDLYHAFNPGSQTRNSEPPTSHLSPEKSILDCCRQGDVVGIEKPTTGFYHAGMYHGCLVMSGPPQNTHSGIISCLTNADVHGFEFAVNLEPCNVASEIERAESIKAKLERARTSGSKNARMDHDILAATERIHRLSAGAVAPVKLQLILHAFDHDPEALQAKILTLRNAVTAMSGAKSYEVALPTSARNFFLAAIPGCPQHEKAYWHLLDDCCAANLLPVCGDSPESLAGAEALYQS